MTAMEYSNLKDKLRKAVADALKNQNICDGDIKCIADHYGFEHQAMKTVEECGELIAALSKFMDGECSKDAVIGEMADVMVMLEQMRYFLNIDSDTLYKTMDAKICRQLGRIIAL